MVKRLHLASVADSMWLRNGVQTVGRKTSWAKDVWANYFFGRQTIGRQQSFQKRRFAERRLGDKGLSSLHFVSIVISLKLDVISHAALDAVVLTRYPFGLVQVNALAWHRPTKHRKRMR